MGDDNEDGGWMKEPLSVLLWIIVFAVGYLVLSNIGELNDFINHWLGAHS